MLTLDDLSASADQLNLIQQKIDRKKGELEALEVEKVNLEESLSMSMLDLGIRGLTLNGGRQLKSTVKFKCSLARDRYGKAAEYLFSKLSKEELEKVRFVVRQSIDIDNEVSFNEAAAALGADLKIDIHHETLSKMAADRFEDGGFDEDFQRIFKPKAVHTLTIS